MLYLQYNRRSEHLKKVFTSPPLQVRCFFLSIPPPPINIFDHNNLHTSARLESISISLEMAHRTQCAYSSQRQRSNLPALTFILFVLEEYVVQCEKKVLSIPLFSVQQMGSLDGMYQGAALPNSPGDLSSVVLLLLLSPTTQTISPLLHRSHSIKPACRSSASLTPHSNNTTRKTPTTVVQRIHSQLRTRSIRLAYSYLPNLNWIRVGKPDV